MNCIYHAFSAGFKVHKLKMTIFFFFLLFVVIELDKMVYESLALIRKMC